MAWKVDKEGDGFKYFETCHLDPKTLKFLTILRSDKDKEEKQNNDRIREFESNLIDTIANDDADGVSSLRNLAMADDAGRDGRVCNLAACVLQLESFREKFLENAALRKKTKDLSDAAGDIDEVYVEFSQQLSEAQAETAKLEMALSTFLIRQNNELNPIIRDQMRTRTALLQQIRALQNELNDARAEEASSRASIEREMLLKQSGSEGFAHQPNAGDIPYSVYTPVEPILLTFKNSSNYHQDAPSKHTGRYNTVGFGRREWSCCMRKEFDAPGCSDDISIDMRSELLVMPADHYKPYSLGNKIHQYRIDPPPRSSIKANSTPANGSSTILAKPISSGSRIQSQPSATNNPTAVTWSDDTNPLPHGRFSERHSRSKSAAVSMLPSHHNSAVDPGRPDHAPTAHATVATQRSNNHSSHSVRSSHQATAEVPLSQSVDAPALHSRRARPHTAGATNLRRSSAGASKHHHAHAHAHLEELPKLKSQNQITLQNMHSLGIAENKVVSLNPSSLLVSSNTLLNGHLKPGTIREEAGDMTRKGGRPLTAQTGPHLLHTLTSAPSSGLSLLTARIV